MQTGANKNEPKIELTKEQKEEVDKVFAYNEKAELTDKELEIVSEMFDTPEKLLILRKALHLFTAEERGLLYVSPQSLVNASPSDLQTYAIETAVNNLATERVRNALYSLYRRIKDEKTKVKREEFEKKNKEEFEDEKKREKHEELLKKTEEKLGENL